MHIKLTLVGKSQNHLVYLPLDKMLKSTFSVVVDHANNAALNGLTAIWPGELLGSSFIVKETPEEIYDMLYGIPAVERRIAAADKAIDEMVNKAFKREEGAEGTHDLF